ncbi:SAM domain-containing protein SAMSN-1a [Hypomesus transpacificus]|uniref:SAM domain-containing protein SAMSN-1a n=1 Tax=Hypomesus transpacificus TaxID=137520 RepID=UPI001F072839|nr:SAM domain-containing protein SAMSN-1a [Hypomesus transpacificus]
MNLFCFSLEGSMDSLYEAVQDSSDAPVYTIPSRSSSRSCSRSCSPAVLLEDNAKWSSSGRSISMEISQMQSTNLKKKKRRTHVSKSMSDNEALDHAGCDTVLWLPANNPEDLVHMKNNQNEDVVKTAPRTGQAKAGREGHQSSTRKKDKSPSQSGGSEVWPTPTDRPNSRQRDVIVHTNGDVAEPRGTAKRSQKAGKKANGKNGKEGTKKSHDSKDHLPPDPLPVVGQYLDLAQGPARIPVPSRASTLPAQENTTPGVPDLRKGPGGSSSSTPSHQRWSNPAESTPAWGTSYHTCRRPLTEYRPYAHDFTLPRGSVTDVDLSEPSKMLQRAASNVSDKPKSKPKRSTSFGRFENNRQQPSPAKLEENVVTLGTEESGSETIDPTKSASLGKKMKAISLTMRRRMGKKHVKSFSEEMGDETDKDHEGEAESSPAVEQGSEKTSNSLESLYSGQSSSSGVTSASEGSSTRDSLKVDEDGSNHGQFCGKARVHTDFVPSPYDTDSLKLKVGDIISIISKPPMGIWTGMLENKVGNFKFIYVDVLVEKKKEEEAPKIRPQKVCRRPRPKTLLELLERLQLEEYASALLLNGYQTVEDLTHLQEKHLIELNVTDPEHRRRLLAAADYRYIESEDVRESEEPKSLSSRSLEEEKSDCTRDSGCFIPSECTDNSKEDTDNQGEPHTV